MLTKNNLRIFKFKYYFLFSIALSSTELEHKFKCFNKVIRVCFLPSIPKRGKFSIIGAPIQFTILLWKCSGTTWFAHVRWGGIFKILLTLNLIRLVLNASKSMFVKLILLLVLERSFKYPNESVYNRTFLNPFTFPVHW